MLSSYALCFLGHRLFLLPDAGPVQILAISFNSILIIHTLPTLSQFITHTHTQIMCLEAVDKDFRDSYRIETWIKMHSVCTQTTQGSLLPIMIFQHKLMMNWPARVHWVGLQAFSWPPSVHSTLLPGHARNVHTYRHKHSGTAWKLVAGYPTFLTWVKSGPQNDKTTVLFVCTGALNGFYKDLCGI